MSRSAASDDTRDLADFGYKQSLDRRLGGFSAFAAGFSYLSILTGLPQLFYIGYSSGGPAFFWTWPLIFLGQMLPALCFAELSAKYPLSGGVYQWSRRSGNRAIGWMAGWIYMSCAVVTLASVALALQATLPQISPVFQLVGSSSDRVDSARNAVLLGCVLIALSTVINAVGVRLLAIINNVGVFAEIVGVVVLILLVGSRPVRGFEAVFDTAGRGEGLPLGYLGPFLAAALTPSFVFYGFDTAGTLVEETRDPRRRAPLAILTAITSVGLTGALLILVVLRGVPDLRDPELGRLSGGMPYAFKQVVGEGIGLALLLDVALAVTVCTLTVHAAAVRLMFSMARDNSLPFSEGFAKISEKSKTPVLPAVVLGAAALAFLVVNIDFPQITEVMTSVSIVWANLAYLFVTAPLLLRRLRSRREPRIDSRYFSLGRLGLPINILAVVWSVLLVANIAWPRSEIYGEEWYRRFGAFLYTAGMLAIGASYYYLGRRRRGEILESHRAESFEQGMPAVEPAG